jgi:hypothetical protein
MNGWKRFSLLALVIRAEERGHVTENELSAKSSNGVFSHQELIVGRLPHCWWGSGSSALVTMQADDLHGSGFSIDESQPSIKVIIVYDHLDTAKRAEAIYERLAGSLHGSGFEFEQRLWRFDVLEDEGFCAEAALDAADADIVIVATNDDTELPKGVQNWLETSLKHHAGAAALVALLRNASTPLAPYLKDVARRGGMDFFAQTEDEPHVLKPGRPRSLSTLLDSEGMGDPHRLANN